MEPKKESWKEVLGKAVAWFLFLGAVAVIAPFSWIAEAIRDSKNPGGRPGGSPET